MAWMPAKAWTSDQPVGGYRHFERVMTGGRGPTRWVELAAVLNPRFRERVLWSELKDPNRWLSGWQPIVELDGDGSLGDASESAALSPHPAETLETP